MSEGARERGESEREREMGGVGGMERRGGGRKDRGRERVRVRVSE